MTVHAITAEILGIAFAIVIIYVVCNGLIEEITWRINKSKNKKISEIKSVPKIEDIMLSLSKKSHKAK